MIKVMIVEDEPAAMNYITSLIRTRCSGLEIVAQAEDGLDAVDFLKNTQVDILITDVQMTHMSGIELAQWVSASMPDIITLIISGHSDFEYAKGALKAGVVEYLLKPLNPATFVEAMGELARKVLLKQRDRRRRWLRKAASGTLGETPFPGCAPDGLLLLGVLILGGGANHIQMPDDVLFSPRSEIGGSAATYIFRENEICFAIPWGADCGVPDDLISMLADGAPYHAAAFKTVSASGGHELPDMLRSARDMMASGACKTLQRQGEGGKLASDIESYINEHLSQPLSVQNICDVFGISASYLNQLFRKHINKSFVEHVTDIRIGEAKKMMKQQPEMPIKDIAEQLGFSDQFYFSKVFRSATGMPPSEYRK